MWASTACRARLTARPLVLVPGARLGGWAWRDVAARLRSLGHDVFPVTLTATRRFLVQHSDRDGELLFDEEVAALTTNSSGNAADVVIRPEEGQGFGASTVSSERLCEAEGTIAHQTIFTAVTLDREGRRHHPAGHSGVVPDRTLISWTP